MRKPVRPSGDPDPGCGRQRIYLIYLIHNPILFIFRHQHWLWMPLQMLGALATCLLVGIGLLLSERSVTPYVWNILIGHCPDGLVRPTAIDVVPGGTS